MEKTIDKSEAEAMQDEMHQIIKGMMDKNPKLEYIDCVVTYITIKLSDQQKQILFLEEKINTLEDEMEQLKPDDEFWDMDDEEENIEPVS